MSNIKLLNAEGIEKGIKSIQSAGTKLDAQVQLVGLSCLAHIEAHGDVRLFNRLWLALSKGTRKSALTGWALAFGKLNANTGDNKKEVPFVYAKDKVTDIAGAASNPWYGFAPEKAPDEVFDVKKALNALLARAGKAKSNNAPELLAKVRAVVEEVDF